jgi:3-methyladenine DNA glycosylase AlkD
MQAHLAQLEEIYQANSNPSKAEEMERYMKNLFPFFGIQAPIRRTISKDWLKLSSVNFSSASLRWQLVQELWLREPREYQHICIDWIGSWKKKDWVVEDASQLTWILSNKSWWDSVDIIASHFVGNYVQLFPKEGAELIASYRDSSNMWLNRTAILFQLLFDICQQFEPNKEFFIQKAIGWSLREVGKTYPTEVKEMIESLKLSGLARREAMRRLV